MSGVDREPASFTGPLSPNVGRTVRWVVIGLLLFGCLLVVRPFAGALAFAVVLAVSTWPAVAWLSTRLGGRPILASVLGCVGTVALMILPATLLAHALADGIAWLMQLLVEWRDGEPTPPGWLGNVPLFGPQLLDWWHNALSAEPDWLLSRLSGPARDAAVASGELLANGMLQGAMATVVLYFLYRHGDELVGWVQELAFAAFGAEAQALVRTVHATVTGVMISVIGAGLGQAIVATVGFTLVGVPNALLLGALTFVLSMVPVGPPIIWLGVSLWLLRNGHPAWMTFMLLYGLFGISSIDNVLKPYLISRSSHLPFALTLLGVVGGVLAFGLMGIFVGPTLLALARQLLSTRMAQRRATAALPAAGPVAREA